MKNTKVPGWLLSFVLILGVALPCMFATAKDTKKTESVFRNDTEEAIEQEERTPVEDAEQEEEIPVEDAEQEEETPVEDTDNNDGVPETDKPALYARIMACTSLEEIGIVLEEATDEEFASLTDEENMEIVAYIESFEPDPLPPVVVEKYDDEPVASEIVYPTVSFTKVAPFGTPVTGGAN